MLMTKGNGSWLIHGDDDVVVVLVQMTMMMMMRKIGRRQLSKITCKTFQYLPCVGGERWRTHDDGDDDGDDDAVVVGGGVNDNDDNEEHLL